MKHLRKIWLICCCCLAVSLSAAEWQWSVPVTEAVSSEVNGHPQAFLWVPSDCRTVKAVVVGMHNMTEETLFDLPQFRAELVKAGIALVWVSPVIDQVWDVRNGCQKAFDKMMADLAEVSGYAELSVVPVVPLGHSAMATFPWNFALLWDWCRR